jgi:dihydroorotate dehydrogenase
MPDLFSIFGPLLRSIDPEVAHRLAILALRAGLVPRPAAYRDEILRTTLWHRDFFNPVGLAAGFDKNGEVAETMFGFGFGFTEIGSVTPRPQAGNPKPRLFRLVGEQGVINRMGFNNDGAERVAARLADRKTPFSGVIGINLGMNRDSNDVAADYVFGVRKLARFADYIVVNVSSPNTPKLRALQGREPLQALLGAVAGALDETALGSKPALLLKVAPDLTDEDIADIADVAVSHGIDGLIATNTTTARPDNLISEFRNETGGLSGKPLFGQSTAVLSKLYAATGGRLPIIGVGGVSNGDDAYAKIRAGASLVQLYSAMVYDGPALAVLINRDLAVLLRRDGFASVADAVGVEYI